MYSELKERLRDLTTVGASHHMSHLHALELANYYLRHQQALQSAQKQGWRDAQNL